MCLEDEEDARGERATGRNGMEMSWRVENALERGGKKARQMAANCVLMCTHVQVCVCVS